MIKQKNKNKKISTNYDDNLLLTDNHAYFWRITIYFFDIWIGNVMYKYGNWNSICCTECRLINAQLILSCLIFGLSIHGSCFISTSPVKTTVWHMICSILGPAPVSACSVYDLSWNALLLFRVLFFNYIPAHGRSSHSFQRFPFVT